MRIRALSVAVPVRALLVGGTALLLIGESGVVVGAAPTGPATDPRPWGKAGR